VGDVLVYGGGVLCVCRVPRVSLERYEGYEYVDVVPAPAVRTSLEGHWVCEDREVPTLSLKSINLHQTPERSYWILHGTHGVVCAPLQFGGWSRVVQERCYLACLFPQARGPCLCRRVEMYVWVV
jgi:hypothetical protein